MTIRLNRGDLPDLSRYTGYDASTAPLDEPAAHAAAA